MEPTEREILSGPDWTVEADEPYDDGSDDAYAFWLMVNEEMGDDDEAV